MAKREPLDPLDDKVRTRLAEIRAAAGVPHSQVSLEVLYFLPTAFLRGYEMLFSTALRSDNGESDRAAGQQTAAQVGKAKGAGAKPQKRHKKAWVVLDEGALRLKGRMDQRLRGMARDIQEELALLNTGQAATRQQIVEQCGSCHLFVQRDWVYCAKCGHQLID